MSTVLNIGDDAFSFDDVQQLRRWLENERDRWQWMHGKGPTQNAWNTSYETFMQLMQDVSNNANAGNPLHISINNIEARLRHGPLVYSNSDEGRRILAIRESEGDDAGAAAYSFYRQFISFSEVRSVAALRGVMAFAYPAVAPVDQVLKDLKTERAQLRRTVTEVRDRFDVLEHGLRDRAVALLASKRSLSNDAIRAIIAQGRLADEQRAAKWSEVAVRIDEAILQLHTTEVAYAEKLGLEAPVTYWKRKSRLHKAKEAQHLRMLRFYFGGAAVAILFVFYQAATKLHGLIMVPTPVLVVVGAGLAFFAALVLWVARILTRLYLSEHHLRTDADERATMANAYLALIHKGSLEPTDRAIILQALFRPSADGVVKDDGPPDLNAIVALSKIGMPGPAK